MNKSERQTVEGFKWEVESYFDYTENLLHRLIELVQVMRDSGYQRWKYKHAMGLIEDLLEEERE